MNVFVIPSWYPSASNPLNGIFVKEQVVWMSEYYNDLNFGISRWGQNDESFLLHSTRPFKSFKKLLSKPIHKDKRLNDQVIELFSPAWSYTSIINRGNLKGKLKACFTNLKKFEDEFGKVDVIHAHVGYPGGRIAELLNRQLKIPYVITEHMTPFPQKYHLTKTGSLIPELASALENADQLITVSGSLKKRISEFNIERSISVIPNFIEPGFLSPQKTERANTAFTFITVCGLHFDKGLKELLIAIKHVTSKDPDFRFIIVGDGPHREQIVSLIRELRIHDKVEMAGYKPRHTLSKWYEQADAHILTSYNESFGVTYIEAMAVGLPSIAAAIGGPLDIIDDLTGLLVKHIDPKLIAEKILWIKENYSRFNRSKIKKAFEEKYSVKAVAPKIRSVYESLV